MTYFNGPAYTPEYDLARLSSQQAKVKAVMGDGNWHTIEEVTRLVGGGESSVSAQIRHLKKPRFGSNTIDRRRRGDKSQGLFEYRLVLEIQQELF